MQQMPNFQVLPDAEVGIPMQYWDRPLESCIVLHYKQSTLFEDIFNEAFFPFPCGKLGRKKISTLMKWKFEI